MAGGSWVGGWEYDGVVGFLDVSVFSEKLVHPGEGFGGTCKNDDSTDGSVKTMYKPEKDLPGLVVFHLYVVFDGVEKSDIACAVALANFAGRFVDND